MNSHKNARLTLKQRADRVKRITVVGVKRAAVEFRVNRQTAGKWKARHTARPEALLGNWSRRPQRTRSVLTPEQRHHLMVLRIERTTLREIAFGAGCTVSTARGDLLHLDIKTLGRIVRPGHRVTGDPRDSTDGAGCACIHIAIDDHSRVSFAPAYPDETRESTVAFLKAALAFHASLGIRIAPAHRQRLGVSLQSVRQDLRRAEPET